MSARVAKALQRLQTEGLARADNTRGCTEEQVSQLEANHHIRFPAAYRQFLLALGDRAGRFLVGSDLSSSRLTSMQVEARELSGASAVPLPASAFVYVMHQGYQFLCFMVDGTDDPEVLRFEEGGRLEPLHVSFSQWLLSTVEEEITSARELRQSLLNALLGLTRALPQILQDLRDSVPATADLAVLTRRELSSIMKRVMSGELTFAQMVDWASEVELVDDIGREASHEEVVNTILFEMATPQIDNRDEAGRVNEWRGRLLGLNVDLTREGVHSVTKDMSITRLLEELRLPQRSWQEIDNWDGDLFAVGIAQSDDPRQLVYVSTWGMPPGRYYYECEASSGPEAEDHVVADKGDQVDFDTLLRAMTAHLSRAGR